MELVTYEPGSPRLWAVIATRIDLMCRYHPEMAYARQLWQQRKSTQVVHEIMDLGLDSADGSEQLLKAIAFYEGLEIRRVSAPVRGNPVAAPVRARNAPTAVSAIDLAWIEQHERAVETYVAERSTKRYRPDQYERGVGEGFSRMAARYGLTVGQLFDRYLRGDRRGEESSHWANNPKRDGSPTRGEMRKSKHVDYLRSIRQRGRDAEASIKRLTGRGRGEVVLRAEKTETQEAHPGHYATAPAPENTQRLAAIEAVEREMAAIRDQMQDLEDDDEALADQLSERLVDLSEKRKRLREGLVATNPGRHRGRNEWRGSRDGLARGRRRW